MKIKVKRICQQCGREFTGTLKSKWCSDVCKMRAYRNRKATTASNVTEQPQEAGNA